MHVHVHVHMHIHMQEILHRGSHMHIHMHIHMQEILHRGSHMHIHMQEILHRGSHSAQISNVLGAQISHATRPVPSALMSHAPYILWRYLVCMCSVPSALIEPCTCTVRTWSHAHALRVPQVLRACIASEDLADIMSELAPGVLGPEIASEIASVIASGAASESAGRTSVPGPWTLDPSDDDGLQEGSRVHDPGRREAKEAEERPPVCISYEDSNGSQVAFYWY